MKIQTKIKKRYTFIVAGILAMVTLVTAIGYAIYNYTSKTHAYLNGFDAGNIMSDFVMSNKNTMSEADINNFLHSKNPCNNSDLRKADGYWHLGYTVRDGHFVCMADENFGGESAAHIIWQAAQDYNINPQVLIVLLQKEQGLVTDTYPNHKQYAKATGFACPDNGNGCDPINSGFKNQVRRAAELFRDVLNGGWSNYPAYSTQFVQYSPNRACGGANIYIQNRATSALYRYTPYVPNQAALNTGFGKGDGCSAYGNRNFYNYFTDWFGSTVGYGYSMVIGGGIERGYNEAGGFHALGYPIMNESCGLKDSGCFQVFERGNVYWVEKLGAHVIHGGIRDKWYAIGSEWGQLGYPTSNEIGGLTEGGVYQAFERGAMYYSDSTGAHPNKGGIREEYAKFNYENGFGYPTNDENCGLVKNGCYQGFERGIIYWTPELGGMNIYGGIKDKWASMGYENSTIGYPTKDERCIKTGCYRDFENGSIYYKESNGQEYYNSGELAKKYRSINRSEGPYGYPVMDQTCGLVNKGCYQNLENGNATIYYSSKTGAHIVHGGIKDIFAKSGYEWIVGLPTSEEIPYKNGAKQEFEKATIYWSDSNYSITRKQSV